MKRKLAVVAIAIGLILGLASPADASATYWKNDPASQTYVTVEVHGASGYYYRNIQPGYAAGSAYVTVEFYKLTAGWCSYDYKITTLNSLIAFHVGTGTNNWVRVPYNEVTYVEVC